MSNSHQEFNTPYPQDIQNALDEFEKESQIEINALSKNIEDHPASQIIYHYTNDVGLRGILESGRLWLSDIFNLNDPSELEHGILIAVSLLMSKAASGSPELEELTRLIENCNLETANYFICSFSFCGDDLGQWRAYADNGRGYALGFDAKVLQAAFEKQGCEVPMLSVSTLEIDQIKQPEKSIPATFSITYSDDQLIKIHTKIIDRMIHLILWLRENDLSDLDSSSLLADLSTRLYVQIVLASLQFKHEAYDNEKECRFLEVHGKMEPAQVKLRPRPYSLVRYREFNWKRTAAEALRKIVIGPAADQRGIQFAEDCLRMFCPCSVEITESGIPYRAL